MPNTQTIIFFGKILEKNKLFEIDVVVPLNPCLLDARIKEKRFVKAFFVEGTFFGDQLEISAVFIRRRRRRRRPSSTHTRRH